MASIVEKRLHDGSRAYLVRYRMTDGQQHSKQFKRTRDADAFVNFVEVDTVDIDRRDRPTTRPRDSPRGVAPATSHDAPAARIRRAPNHHRGRRDRCSSRHACVDDW